MGIRKTSRRSLGSFPDVTSRSSKGVQRANQNVSVKSLSATMQMYVCFTSVHIALQLRGNLLSIGAHTDRFTMN